MGRVLPDNYNIVNLMETSFISANNRELTISIEKCEFFLCCLSGWKSVRAYQHFFILIFIFSSSIQINVVVVVKGSILLHPLCFSRPQKMLSSVVRNVLRNSCSATRIGGNIQQVPSILTITSSSHGQRYFSSSTSNSDSNSNSVDAQQEYQKEISDIERQYEERKKRRQSMIGIVVSDKCSKSVTIKVEREKYFTRKFMAHDEEELCDMGDVVRIVPCRPMSKMKRHSVIDIIKKGQRLDLSTDSSTVDSATANTTLMTGNSTK